LAAVKITVNAAPSAMPRAVNSRGLLPLATIASFLP
jgi:hypothetical protein